MANIQSQQQDAHSTWSYPDDHLFFRASTKRQRTPRACSRLIDHADVLARRHRTDVISYTRMKSAGTSGYSTLTDLLNGLVPKSRRNEKDHGKLEKVQDMPYDVLYEIFSHLHPLDLLNLSRTTRLLRTILLHPSSKTVWRTSLASVRALPFCPSDLTEVQYANLAFDDSCHFCLQPGVEQISWLCRVRCCTKCIKNEFISQAELELWIPEELFIEHPDAVFPYILPCNINSSNRGQPLYLLSKAQEYLQELDDIIADRDEEALAAWSEKKRSLQAGKLTHAALCQYWSPQWSYRRSLRSTASYASEVGIVVLLFVFLAMLWRQQVGEFLVQVGTLISVNNDEAPVEL